MKVKDFYELVEQKREPEASLLPNFQYRTRKYPFFQPDIFIYLKCLYLSNSDNFSDELSRFAPFVTDRKALFYYIMDDQYHQFKKKAEKSLTRNRTDMLINAFFDSLDTSDDELDFGDILVNPNMASLDYFSYLEKTGDISFDNQEKILHEDILEIEDDIFGIGLEIEEATPDLLEDDNDIPFLKHQDIIDRFIQKATDEGSLKIHLDTGVEEVLSEDELDNPDFEEQPQDLEKDYFFTQTLANIYIKQKKYRRAYEIIKHLSLNYPEKSIYFADQLSFLEKLIRNTNKK